MRSKESWSVMAKRADFEKISNDFCINPVIARLIRNRDVKTEPEIWKYLKGNAQDMYSPWLLHGVKEAVPLILNAIKRQKKIRVITDYDIDGIMSGYIMGDALKRLGAQNSDVDIPDRILDGYGMNNRIVKKAYDDGVSLIITCDNGIAAHEPIEYAKQLGMQVVVTDHHEITVEKNGDIMMEVIPNADVVINPHQAACEYPQKEICGAVVAYKLAEALLEVARKPVDMVETYIEYAAFATIGDVMPLKDENRIIVKEGLQRIRNTQNIGLRALIQASNIDPMKIDSRKIGFTLGPCINACGRLSSAKMALDLLTETDTIEAANKANEIVELNEKRKAITAEGEKIAIDAVSNSVLNADRVLVVCLPNMHESLTGIIAGKLKEHFNKPSFVFTRVANGMLKGSGRSVEAYSMYEELCEISDILEKFGGHPAAAGVTIKEENLDAFRERLNKNCHLKAGDIIKKRVMDMIMPMDYVTEGLIEQMSLLEPYGADNPEPQFGQKNVRIMYPRVMGVKRNACRMDLVDENNRRYKGIYFGDADDFVADFNEKSTVSTIYRPSINEYNGRRDIQMEICAYQ